MPFIKFLIAAKKQFPFMQQRCGLSFSDIFANIKDGLEAPALIGMNFIPAPCIVSGLSDFDVDKQLHKLTAKFEQ